LALSDSDGLRIILFIKTRTRSKEGAKREINVAKARKKSPSLSG